MRLARRVDDRTGSEQDPEMSRSRRLLRTALLISIGLLYVLSIPWYRPTGQIPDVLFGLPDWVTVALLCYTGVALLNAVVWAISDFRDPPREEGD